MEPDPGNSGVGKREFLVVRLMVEPDFSLSAEKEKEEKHEEFQIHAPRAN